MLISVVYLECFKEMKYDFTSIIDRHNMDALAVDGLGNGKMSPAKPKEGFVGGRHEFPYGTDNSGGDH